ncbi:MAG: DJ-1/PfpI family protein [Bacteroidota bacterium]
MNKIFLILILSLSFSTTFSQDSNSIKKLFVCAPCGGSCDDLTFEKAGKCPHCGMALVEKPSLKKEAEKEISVCFYLQDNVEILDFAGPLEVFVVAGFNVFIVSKTKEQITTQGTLKFVPDFDITNAPESDVMVFFGGAHSKPTNDTAVISWIQARKAKTDYFISVCTGAFILGKAGILDGLTATTYHTQIEALQTALPKTKVLPNVRFVDNGNVITTAGISAGIDGALHFVSKMKGKDFAQKVAQDIEYDSWIPENGLIIKEK